MKILVAHNFYQQAGGEDTGFRSEVALLRDHGHTVEEYIDTNERIDRMNRLSAAGQMIWSRSSQDKLRRAIVNFGPEIVHFHNTFMMISPSAYYTCRALGLPVVQTIQNYRLICLNATLFRENRVCEKCISKVLPWPGVMHSCYRHSRTQSFGVLGLLITHRLLQTWQKKVNVFVTVTDFMRNKLIEGGLPADKIVVKPNFSDLPINIGTAKQNYVLFVGRFSHEKGVLQLLAAWKTIGDIPLLMVGDGPLMDEVKDIINQNKLTNIQLLGWKSRGEVVQYMAEARFLVQPSVWYEGFPMTIVESFACGLPVIASNLGSMSEVIEHSRTGLLFEPGNVEDMEATIRQAWLNESETMQMGRNARQRYQSHYTSQQNYHMLMDIYDRAISS